MELDSHNNWSDSDVSLLQELAKNNTPEIEICMHIGKSHEEIRVKAHELGISLASDQFRYKR